MSIFLAWQYNDSYNKQIYAQFSFFCYKVTSSGLWLPSSPNFNLNKRFQQDTRGLFSFNLQWAI